MMARTSNGSILWAVAILAASAAISFADGAIEDGALEGEAVRAAVAGPAAIAPLDLSAGCSVKRSSASEPGPWDVVTLSESLVGAPPLAGTPRIATKSS